MDPPRKGHCIINLSTEDNSWDPKILFPNSSNTIWISEKRTTSLQGTKHVNLYCPQCVLCWEVSLYTHKYPYQHMQSLVIVSVIQQYQCPTYVHIAMTLYMQWVSTYRISSAVYKIILQETMQVFSLIYAYRYFKVLYEILSTCCWPVKLQYW